MKFHACAFLSDPSCPIFHLMAAMGGSFPAVEVQGIKHLQWTLHKFCHRGCEEAWLRVVIKIPKNQHSSFLAWDASSQLCLEVQHGLPPKWKLLFQAPNKKLYCMLPRMGSLCSHCKSKIPHRSEQGQSGIKPEPRTLENSSGDSEKKVIPKMPYAMAPLQVLVTQALQVM